MRPDGGTLFFDLPAYIKSDILALSVCITAIIAGLLIL